MQTVSFHEQCAMAAMQSLIMALAHISPETLRHAAGSDHEKTIMKGIARDAWALADTMTEEQTKRKALHATEQTEEG